MTSYGEIQTAVKAMKLGASDYIAKPFNPDELLKKIHFGGPLKSSGNQKWFFCGTGPNNPLQHLIFNNVATEHLTSAGFHGGRQ